MVKLSGGEALAKSLAGRESRSYSAYRGYRSTASWPGFGTSRGSA